MFTYDQNNNTINRNAIVLIVKLRTAALAKGSTALANYHWISTQRNCLFLTISADYKVIFLVTIPI